MFSNNYLLIMLVIIMKYMLGPEKKKKKVNLRQGQSRASFSIYVMMVQEQIAYSTFENWSFSEYKR